MKNSLMFSAVLLGSAMALPASAQDAATTAPATTAPATAPAPAAPVAAAPFSDAELVGFANAAIEADKIQKDEAVPAADKPTKMLAAVEAQGLNPTRYNEIAQATRTNPDLVKKIQELASADLAKKTANP